MKSNEILVSALEEIEKLPSLATFFQPTPKGKMNHERALKKAGEIARQALKSVKGEV